ncbi:DinB family protein [Paludisphaera mucosa]|uniref:DinB family protein n=1 Tax=Paludisphaera mucosa TaxID=3030827 RepID=A0ABT6F3V2_9BACT|nr:DinB family protein [Paludisphaera mucosa]MDG3002221.1 DinB family protein [Paludisphaera mucosa]
MRAIDQIRWALRTTDESTGRLVEDMRQTPLTSPTSRGGNHPMWVLGHLAVIEGMIPHTVFGEPNPVQHWWPIFGTGSTPTDDAAAYPPFDEVLATYRGLRAKNLARLEEIGEAGLDAAPKVVPPGFEERMRTVGRTFLLIALHQMFHLGQLADARRAVGKEPFM